mgnify:CR=1 FL=1
MEVRCEDVLVTTRAAEPGQHQAVLSTPSFAPSTRAGGLSTEACADLLGERGPLGLFFLLDRPGGPPFDVTEPEIRGLFSPLPAPTGSGLSGQLS